MEITTNQKFKISHVHWPKRYFDVSSKEDIKEYEAYIESAQQILDLCQSKSEYIIVTKQHADWLYDELEDVDGITYEEEDEKDVRKILSYLTRKDKSASEWKKKDKNR